MFYDHHLPGTQQLPPNFDLRDLTALYYGMTTWVDDCVGRLLKNLRNTGLKNDTIVVFLSDHGDMLGSHGLFNKGMLYEEAIRIPLIFHAPTRLTPRVVSAQVASILDLLPTLVRECGGEVPASVQGQDLGPVLRGERPHLERAGAFIETNGGQIGLRTPTHLYGAQLASDRRQIADPRALFFDLNSDPLQQNNLAPPQNQNALARELGEQLTQWNHVTPWMNSAS